MYEKFNLRLGGIALVIFVIAQFQGWNLFENEANSHGSHSGSGRTYHK